MSDEMLFLFKRLTALRAMPYAGFVACWWSRLGSRGQRQRTGTLIGRNIHRRRSTPTVSQVSVVMKVDPGDLPKLGGFSSVRGEPRDVACTARYRHRSSGLTTFRIDESGVIARIRSCPGLFMAWS